MDLSNLNGLCSICARGGSKGVPNKNIAIIDGKPLIAHSILQAKATGLFRHIAVSSDSSEILAAAKEYGADILVQRPQELASDTAPKLPAIRHCLQESIKASGVNFDYIVDLDSTSPLRKPIDILNVIELLYKDPHNENVITGTPSRRSPYFNMVELDSNDIPRIIKKLDKDITRRQDAPKCFDMNASIYAWKIDAILSEQSLFTDKTRLYIMPEERSLDIDSPLDFEIVSFLLTKASHE
tara:strand:- start:5360 stop:6079 length:720 start_codon:yes stop_codon:yes gene_type:complete